MKKPRGFTLIELLVVISVIALLLAILMPALGKAKGLAQRIVCGNQLRNLSVANSTYASQWNGRYVPIVYTAADTTLAGDGTVAAINNFEPGDDVVWMANPAFRKIMAFDTAARSSKEDSDAGVYDLPDSYLCPSDRISRDPHNVLNSVLTDYGYNSTGIRIWNSSGQRNTSMKYGGFMVDKIKRPAEKLVFTDGIDWWVEWAAADYRKGWDLAGQQTNKYYKQTLKIHGPTFYRHSEGANVAFFDGHVEYRKKQNIFVIADYDANPKRPGMWDPVN